MKKELFMVLVLSGFTTNAQVGRVGINTATPQATLSIEVDPANALSTATSNEGVLIPKLSKVRIANIAAPVDATIVYVSDLTYSGSNTAVADITSKGFYYYDEDPMVPANSKWKKLNVNTGGTSLPSGTVAGQVLKWDGSAWQPGTDTDTSLYTADGTLSEDRTVNMNGKTLSFTGLGNVGIGINADASQKLLVQGNIFSNGVVYSQISSNEGGRIELRNHSKMGTTVANRWAIYNMTGSYGNSLQFWRYYQAGGGGGMVMTLSDDGKVGIGTRTPNKMLQVAGDVYVNTHTDTNTLNVREGLTAKDVTASAGVKGATLTSTGNATIGGLATITNLNVTNNTTVKNVTASGTVKGAALVSTGNISASGTVSAKDVTASAGVKGATLTSTGNATIGGLATIANLNVTNNITAKNVTASETVKGKQLTSTGNINATGAVITKDVTASGIIKGAGLVSTGNLNVSGTTTTKNLNVTGTYTVTNLTATGTVKGANFEATGNMNIAGTMTSTYHINVRNNTNIDNFTTNQLMQFNKVFSAVGNVVPCTSSIEGAIRYNYMVSFGGYDYSTVTDGVFDLCAPDDKGKYEWRIIGI